MDGDPGARGHMSVYRGWQNRTTALHYHAGMWAQGNQSFNFSREAGNEAVYVKSPTSKSWQQSLYELLRLGLSIYEGWVTKLFSNTCLLVTLITTLEAGFQRLRVGK